jgi:hypothetical protein
MRANFRFDVTVTLDVAKTLFAVAAIIHLLW